jgi:hypothetical protein
MFRSTIFIAFPLMLSSASMASAAPPIRLNAFDDWSVYSYQSDKGRTCYALSRPIKMAPAGVDHGNNYLIVSLGGADGSPYVPEALMGYQLKEGSAVKATIDSDKFLMFTKDNGAWVQREEQEPAMVAAMKAGSTLTLEATSARGTSTSYTYSLSGITAALQQIKSCH